jgi:ADP-ribosyl-[dinitrogen reductase] hydrolase
MRVAPIPIAYSRETERHVRDVTGLSSSLTHNRFASGLTEEFAGLIHRALNGCEKSELQTNMVEVSEEKTTNGGYAPESLSSALYHFHSTGSFREAVLQAVNFGNDADTIGAITGQLAGAYYGLSGIPVEWVTGLHNSDALLRVGELLYEIT